jgi:stage V sporulation protein SpoVS
MKDYSEESEVGVEESGQDISNLLLIKGNFDSKEDAKNYVKKLSQAMLVVIQKYGSAKLRCVGAAAVNNAIKAEIIASGEAKKKGINLAVVSSFMTVVFGKNDERTAVVLEVIKLQ